MTFIVCSTVVIVLLGTVGDRCSEKVLALGNKSAQYSMLPCLKEVLHVAVKVAPVQVLEITHYLMLYKL